MEKIHENVHMFLCFHVNFKHKAQNMQVSM